MVAILQMDRGHSEGDGGRVRILAIDPGSMLGWATNQTGRLEWGTEDFRIRNGESSGNRWLRFGSWLGSVLRADHENAVDLVVYERAMFMPKARAAAEIAAGFTTRLEEHCERHGIALQPVAVQTLKAFAIPAVKRKKGDPKLDRSKDAMIDAARARHYESIGRKLTVQQIHMTDNEADALWLYWWALENCGGAPGIPAGEHGHPRPSDAPPLLSKEGI